MKEIKQLDALKNADMSYLYPIFRSLLGYDPFIKLYEPEPESEKLLNDIFTAIGVPADEDLIEFMKITNGAKIDFVTFYSLNNNGDGDRDLNFVNVDLTKRKLLVGDQRGLIVGEYDGDYYCYDKASIIKKDPTLEGYAWGLYSTEKNDYIFSFDNFAALLYFHVQILIASVS